MLDFSSLNKKNDWIYKDERILHEALLNEFSPITINDVQIEGELHINSKVLDIEKHYCSIEKFEKNYKEKKSVAPVWETALEKWITFLEQEYVMDEIHWDYDYTGEYVSGLQKKEPLIFEVYNDITEGENKHLYKYVTSLLHTAENGKRKAKVYLLPQIGFAVALAYMLPKLKSELKLIQQTDISSSAIYVQQPKQKINWTGTAGEFGAIIDLLIEKGYIEDMPVKKNKANIFYELFNIKTGKGETITDRYLIDCFGKDKHSFLPNEIKIPISKNYGKEQTTARKLNGIRAENKG